MAFVRYFSDVKDDRHMMETCFHNGYSKEEKDFRTKKRMWFKNFICQFCYLNTNFSGHLEKKWVRPELPSDVSVLPHPQVVYIFSWN